MVEDTPYLICPATPGGHRIRWFRKENVRKCIFCGYTPNARLDLKAKIDGANDTALLRPDQEKP